MALKMIGSGDSSAAKLTKVEKAEPKVTFIQKVIKGETWLVMASSSVQLEDEFSNLYFSIQSPSNVFLMPPFEPNVLLNLVQQNNILNQCIEAMEVNIDGTGFEFVEKDKDAKSLNKTEEKAATAFFKEPYPGLSFITIRRKLRRTMESVGYAYLEILRNATGKVVGIRNIETAHVRMVKLDAPILVKKTVERDGEEVELQIWDRERRFAQLVASKVQIYYREFGSTRQLHRETGIWEDDKNPVPLDMRASELLMFGINPDTTTPYFLPRWINELPSVVGSRSAEEQNLEFLDAGGMPPAIIFVQGGVLVKDASDQLKMYLSGKNKNKNRAVVVEVQSSGGSLDSNPQKVDVKTERFGAERAQDAMYMKYDENTEEHIRKGFRLPPLFLGEATDYSFATAQTSYMVAEAQVFGPERTEFDAVINKTIVKELGFKTIEFKSKPIILKDANAQLKALELMKDVASRESYLKEANLIAGTTLEIADMPHPAVPAEGEHPGVPTTTEIDHKKMPASTKPPALTSPQPEPKELPEKPTKHQMTMEQLKEEEQKLKNSGLKNTAPAQYQAELHALEVEMRRLKLEEQRLKNKHLREKKAARELIDLAFDFASMRGLVQKREIDPERQLLIREAVDNLHPEDEQAFNTLLAQYAFDDESLADISRWTH